MLAPDNVIPTHAIARYRAPVPAPEEMPERIRRSFTEFADTTATRAPLYARLAAGIAEEPELLALLDAAPATQRQPVLLFAAVHHLLLAEPDEPLAQWYPNLAATPDDTDPLPAFRSFCARRQGDVVALLATRSTQTNEIGRCALFVPPFATLADEVGPLGHVDVGTSAGLNLLLPRYGYRYQPGGDVGELGTVVLECGVRGVGPIPNEMPAVSHSIGLDRDPIDVRDDEATRWLEACVWPDQHDRFERLRAALAMARANPPDVRTGDAVNDVAEIVREVAATGAHPVVTNSWVLSYLTTDQRMAYLAELDRLGASFDLSWVYAESPALVSGLPRPDGHHDDITVLSVARWRDGTRTVTHVARCHPHGYWLHWMN
jgi:hypothetical protein